MRYSILVVFLCGCGAGVYGYDREYVPLSAERDYLEEADRLTYEEVRRNPSDFQSTTLEWFGVVRSVEGVATGPATVRLTFRTHQERHLCGDETNGSCRVTVSEREGGEFIAIVDPALTSDPINVGSLLRVYGSPARESDPEGAPIITARWYRHWPRGTYVTTGDAVRMRR